MYLIPVRTRSMLIHLINFARKINFSPGLHLVSFFGFSMVALVLTYKIYTCGNELSHKKANKIDSTLKN